MNIKTIRVGTLHLQPIVTGIPSYVRDTKDFLYKTKIIKNVPEETHLVTMGAKSLYNIIPTREELQQQRKP